MSPDKSNIISVLYVDDEETLLDIGKRFLERDGGFQVTIQNSAQSALDLLKTSHFDAIISDYHMPGMDGIEFLKEVRVHHGDIPFILFTGRGREEVVILALNNGADFYIQKGGEAKSQFAELSNKIKYAVSRRQAEQDLHGQNLTLSTINQIALEFASLPKGNSVPKAAKNILMQLSGAALTTFSVYYPSEQMLHVLEVEIAPGMVEKIIRRLGKQPDNIKIPVSDDIYRDIVSSITGTKKTLTEMSFGKISPILSMSLQKVLGIDHFISIAYVIEGELYGTSLLGIKRGHPDPSTELLESLAHIIAVSLRRSRAETSLNESEERLRSFIEQMLEGVSIVDYDGRITEWNPAQERITGISRAEAIGMYVWDLATRMIPDPDRREDISSRIKDEITSTIKSGITTEPEPVNYRFCRPDGTIAIANQTVFIIKTPEGNMLGILNQDITRRRLAEEKIKESESSYRGIFNTIQQAIYILDSEGQFIDVNEGAEVMYGYAREEFVGKTPEFLSAPGKNDFAAVVGKIHKALAGEPQQFDFWGRRKNNEIFRKEVRLYKGKYFSKDVVIAVGTDISERKQAELELESTQERLKEAHRLAHIGTWDWDIASDTVTWSEELYHIAGRDPALPAPPYEEHPDLYTPSSWNHLNLAVNRAVTTGEPYNLELELILPDGSTRWTNEFGGVKRDEEGNVIGLHGTVQDITRRKRDEEALREANRKLNLLSGITRHDINNQLTVLMGYLEMLEDSHKEPPLNTYCREATTAAKRISTMIQFTKEYEQLGLNGPVWQKIETAAKMAAVDLLPDSFQLILNTGDHEVFADPMFIMVLYNLFENSTRHGGDVTEITSSFIEEENAGILIIEDNGVGVPASLKEKIFERGFGANTGFGLYLTQEILPITGLSIKETGAEGKGARFEIHMPPGTWRRGSN